MKITRKTTKKGIKILHHYLPSSTFVSSMIQMKVGSTNEPNEKWFGMAHFLEHVMGQKTLKRQDGEKYNELEMHGIYSNAATSKNMTGYWNECLPENFEIAFEYLADKVFQSQFDEAMVEKEKGIITQEILMGEDRSTSKMYRRIFRQLFSGTPISHDVIGMKESVNAFTLQMVEDFYYAQVNNAENLQIFIAGNIKFEKIESIVEKYMEEYFNQDIKKISEKVEYKKADPKDYLFVTGNSELPKISISYPILGLQSDNVESMALLDFIMGSGKGSKLNLKLKVENSLVSEVATESSCFLEGGIWTIYFSSEKNNIEKVYKIIQSEIQDVLNNGFSKDELVRGKNLLRTKYLKIVENPSMYNSAWGKYSLSRRELLTDKEIGYEDILKNIEKTSPEDIQKVLEKIVKNKPLLGAIASDGEVEDIVKSLKAKIY